MEMPNQPAPMMHAPVDEGTDESAQLPARFKRQIVDYRTSELAGTIVIVRRRQSWSGCQWLFWATIALGLAMSAIGLMGWAADELMSGHDTWLAWPAVFALFGGVYIGLSRPITPT